MRKFELRDADELFRILSDEEVNRFLPWFPHKTREETLRFMQDSVFADYDKAIAYRYAVILRSENRLIGYLSFLGIDDTNERKCPACGTALSEYSATGLVGCAHCYETFRKELMPSVRRIHGKTLHIGKRPLGDGKFFELVEERNRLRAELERALKEKRMKDAERLNRDIREISEILLRRDFGGSEDE